MILPGISAAEPARETQQMRDSTAGRHAEMESLADVFSALLTGVLAPTNVPQEHAPATPAEVAADDGASDAEAETARVIAAAVASAKSGDMAGAAEAAEAAEAIGAAEAATGSSSVRSANRSLKDVDPVFRTRLGRVVERMQEEFGHRVEITETVRSQARQEHLYAQGRSRPGPVVTWTLNSNHKSGRAADVIIDGSYGNPAAYQRLAQIAAEEGLQTLGPKDPGHIELPKQFASVSHATEPGANPAQASASVDAGYASEGAKSGRHGIAQVASVAKVAEVARVAPVAQVAQVAAPGMVGAARRGAGAGGGESQSGGTDSQTRAVEAAMLRPESGFAPGGAFSAAMLEGGATPGGVDMVGRLARILEMKDGAPSSSVDHMILRLDNGAGGEDRIRLDMRGSGLGATIDAGSAADAERMLSRLPELRKALERQGVDAEGLKIRAATLSARDVAPAVEGVRAALRPEGGAESAFDKDRERQPGQDESGEGTRNPHSRSRREHHGKEAS